MRFRVECGKAILRNKYMHADKLITTCILFKKNKKDYNLSFLYNLHTKHWVKFMCKWKCYLSVKFYDILQF